MSPENVEIVRRAYDAWNRGDWDGVFTAFDEETEIQPPELWPETQPVRGQENVRQAFQAVVETSNDLPSMRVLELRDSGDRVLAMVEGSGSGRGSGIHIVTPFSQVFRLRGGRIVRIDFYLDRA